jgi:formyltetrahydrofolate deformylase
MVDFSSKYGPAWVLTLTCEDRVGIVAGVSTFLAERDGFILDSQQYADLDTGRFFMRVVFKKGGKRFPGNHAALPEAFTPIADQLGLDWDIAPMGHRPRALVAVSKGSHCLADLLHRQESGTLSMEIIGVVSNHDTLRGLTERHGLAFHVLPAEDRDRAIASAVAEMQAEYLILARYMQILSKDLTEQVPGRCINIHHSFLPGFKGAKPYHRAHDRGVKLIGATAHFVTADLDEGPIIEQAVERVDHRASVDEMIRVGRDIESLVLARAVNAVGERRVFLNGAKTVVFR